MRRILITNDDGIDASGIVRLATAAEEFGEVWVIAPTHQRSALSHSITLREPIKVYPHDFAVRGVHAFSCSGTPADCVRMGSVSVMPSVPDVVLSGINYGYNAGTDTQYSATVGAAFEAVLMGYRSVALSEDMVDEHEVTDHYLREVLEECIDINAGYGTIVNVNFPSVPLAECRGILRNRRTSMHSFFNDTYDLIRELEDGGREFMVNGKRNMNFEKGSDMKALQDGYVSIGMIRNLG